MVSTFVYEQVEGQGLEFLGSWVALFFGESLGFRA